MEYMMRGLHDLETICLKNYMIKELYMRKIYWKITICLKDFMISKLHNIENI